MAIPEDEPLQTSNALESLANTYVRRGLINSQYETQMQTVQQTPASWPQVESATLGLVDCALSAERKLEVHTSREVQQSAT